MWRCFGIIGGYGLGSFCHGGLCASLGLCRAFWISGLGCRRLMLRGIFLLGLGTIMRGNPNSIFFHWKVLGFTTKTMHSSHHQYQFPPNISRHLHTYGCLRLRPQGCSRIVLFSLSSTNRMLLLFLCFVILCDRARSVVSILLRLLYPRFRRCFIRFCGCGFCRILGL